MKGNVEFMEYTGLHMEHNMSIIGKILEHCSRAYIIGNFKSIIGTSLINTLHIIIITSNKCTAKHIYKVVQLIAMICIHTITCDVQI